MMSAAPSRADSLREMLNGRSLSRASKFAWVEWRQVPGKQTTLVADSLISAVDWLEADPAEPLSR